MIWPATLPQYPQRDGLSFAGGENVLASQTDRGPPKRRRRGTRIPSRLTASYFLTPAQYADVFQPFVVNDLGQGVKRFDLPDPFGAGTLSAALVGGMAGITAEPGPGVMVTVTLSLEVL